MTNYSGKLDASALRKFIKELGHEDSEQVDKFLHDVATSIDGQLSFLEFLNGAPEWLLMEPPEKRKEAEDDELKKKWEHKTKELKISKIDKHTDEQKQKV